MMFSKTVILGKRLKCWKTMPTCWRTKLMSVFLSVRLYPLIMTSPLVASSKPFNVRRNVDLPEPEGPIIQTTSPLLNFAEIPLRTSFLPYVL